MIARLAVTVLAFLSIFPRTGAAQFVWPSDAARVSGWQEDLDSVLTTFLPRDRSFDSAARSRFARDIRVLRDSIATLTDPQLTVRLATAVAGARNAHTRLYLLRNRTVLRRYPIRVWWFGNDLVIVRAHQEQSALLGGRILALAGHPVSQVAARVAPLYAANRSWTRYLSTYLLTSPEILQGVGALAGDDLAVTVKLRDGRDLTQRLTPLPLERSDQPVEAWWDLSPAGPSVQGPWLSLLPADTAGLPLYLRHLDRFYWDQRIPSCGTLYLQYNRAQDQPGGETVRELADRLLQELEGTPPARLVIDLRFNTGGNLDLADPFFRRIAALPWAAERGRLFVITGRATFSAGITPVAFLRQSTRATVVGEPPGDGLDFWAEGGNILLRNTKLTLHYADGFHSYSPREYPAFRPYYYDLSVANLGPDIPVTLSLAQYLAGRDPAMEAITTCRP